MQLLEMSLSGSVFILAVLAVRAAAVNYLPKKTFLVLWGVVLVHLLLPVRIPSSLSIYSRIPRFNQKADARQASEPLDDPDQVPKESSEADVGVNTGSDTNMDAEKEAASERSFEAGQFLTGQRRAEQQAILKNGLFVVWAVGFLGCLSVFAAMYVICIRRFCVSAVVKNEFVESWLKEHSGRRHIQIRQCGFVKAPLTYGLWHPVILMPERTDWEDKRRLSYVLEHEFVHIRRLDAAAKIVLAAALAVHWFNPMVWMMYAVCSRDLELSCDETVIRTFGESARAEYARVLIGTEEQKRMPLPLCSGFCRNVMRERIVAIMKIRKKSKAAGISAAAVVCVLAVMFATSSSTGIEEREAVPPAGKITNISLNLSNQAAADISNAVIAHMEKEYEGYYQLDNYEFSFCNEVIADDMLSLDIKVGADMTSILDPKDSHYAQGMLEAVEQIDDAAKKQAAQKLYAEYIEEMMRNYMVTEQTGFSYQVHLPAAQAAADGALSYDLFYLDENGREVTPFREDDRVKPLAGREDGRAYIEENI